MKRFGTLSAAVLSLTLGSLTLGIALPAFAQEQHDQQEDKDKDKPAQEKEKKAVPEKSAKPEEKRAQDLQDKGRQPEAKTTQEQHTQSKPEQHASAGRIPDDRFKANFGREHSFRVSQSDYQSRRFQYGGYWFGFQSAWPSKWLYTQDVYVIEINGVYYLCNASYPGVNLMLSVTL